jgi:uncharacterized protein DUF3175
MSDEPNKWSKAVTEHDRGDAISPGIFKSGNPDEIAAALQKAAQDPSRASDDPYRSAMSMLDFYINRAGRNLSATERAALEKTKTALRKRFGKADS